MNEIDLRRQYLPIVKRLGSRCASDLGVHESLLIHESNVRAYFAPFNTTDHCIAALEKARILFIGLTPGLSQTKKAFDDFFAPTAHNSVSFAGSMRAILCDYFDQLGLAKRLPGIDRSVDLFTEEAGYLAASTSLLRYPVFKLDGSNYSGSPKMAGQPFLLEMAHDLVVPVLLAAPERVLVVPLGKAVESGLMAVLGDTKPKAAILSGFPHPSGGNGHRTKQFAENKADMAMHIERFAAAHWA